MAELLQRECNAAIPEVDLGTDVFAFKDDREEVARIQVKTNSNPHEYKDGSGYSAKFAIPLKQLEHPDDRPALYYALAVRLKGNWTDFLVISRTNLREFYEGDQPFGYVNRQTGDLEITVEFRAAVMCSGQNLTEYRNAWDKLPPLQPPPQVAALEQGVAAGPSAAGVGHAVVAPVGLAPARTDQPLTPPPPPPTGDEPPQP
jgi:hypothetical protein